MGDEAEYLDNSGEYYAYQDFLDRQRMGRSRSSTTRKSKARKGVTKMSIVAVQFQNKNNSEEFSGREYTYFSTVPLVVGDVILAPTKNGQGVVRVCRTDMKDSEIDERVLPFMKTIEELVRPEDLPRIAGEKGCENNAR